MKKNKTSTVTMYSLVMDKALTKNGKITNKKERSTDWLILMDKQKAISILIQFANEVLSGLGNVSKDASVRIATTVYLEL